MKVAIAQTKKSGLVSRGSLHQQITADTESSIRVKKPRQKRGLRPDTESDDENVPQVQIVDAKLSNKILRLAAEQQVEETPKSLVELEEGARDPQVDGDGRVTFQEEETFLTKYGPLDLDVFKAPCSSSISTDSAAPKQVTLGELILAKLQERAAQEGKHSQPALDPQVLQVYQSIGEFLSHYKSGRLPKAFKIIPRLANWEEILYTTNPLEWTPNAMHEAVRIFASSLKSRMAQRFYNLVLLPAVREDIQSHKKLNFHYYQALKLAFFKPSAWFQGILFPVLLEGCTLREAVIFGSIISKVSIPPLHVAAALLRLCELHKSDLQDWAPSTSYIINILLNKKCSLPLTAVNGAVRYFSAFTSIPPTQQLPVVWHQALLTLVQRYKFDLSHENRVALRDLLRVHYHHLIGPEIRKEMQHAEALKWQTTTVPHSPTQMDLA